MDETPGNPAGRPGYDTPGEEWYAATQADRPRSAPVTAEPRDRRPLTLGRLGLWALSACLGVAAVLAFLINLSQR